jgi:hypothetical protein
MKMSEESGKGKKRKEEKLPLRKSKGLKIAFVS